MSGPADDYTPQSPNLSDYAPQSPDFSGYTAPAVGPQIDTTYPYSVHRASYDASPYFTPLQQLPPPFFPPIIENTEPMARGKRVKAEDTDEWAPESEDSTSRAGQLKKGGISETRVSTATAEVEVKTKFPVARIKRIMQADEEVGKVAQVTPIAVSKALELFMIQLVTKSADEARARSSKRVTAAHLKQVVVNDKVFDFLDDIIAKVQDPTSASKTETSEDGDGKKKKGGGGSRRKKESDDL